MIAFSTSGKSREVIEILELSRHLGVETIIGVTSHPDSDLRDQSDFVLDMGEIEEPCPLGLTPSASMAVMLAISDAIALSLMEQKGVTREDYGLRHHGGYLGRAARTDNAPPRDLKPARYSGIRSNRQPDPSVTNPMREKQRVPPLAGSWICRPPLDSATPMAWPTTQRPRPCLRSGWATTSP